MILKIGKFELTESLSEEIYLKINQWHADEFGSEMTYEECQNFLYEYGYYIDFGVVDDDFFIDETEFNIHETYFAICPGDFKIMKYRGKQIYGYQLGIVQHNEPDLHPDDICLKRIQAEIEKEENLSGGTLILWKPPVS